MANQRLSDLPSIAGLQSGDLIYVVRGGTDYKLDAGDLAALMGPDYAGIHDGAGTVAIDIQNVYHLVDVWGADGPAEASTPDYANNRILLGATRPYGVLYSVSATASGVNTNVESEAWLISKDAKVITGITQADPGVVTCVGHGFSNGDTVKITGVVGMTELNDKLFKVANVAADTFELQDAEAADLDTSGFGAYASAGTAALATGIAEANREYRFDAVGSSGSSFPENAGVIGDAVELHLKNEDGVNDVDLSTAHLWLFGL